MLAIEVRLTFVAKCRGVETALGQDLAQPQILNEGVVKTLARDVVRIAIEWGESVGAGHG